MDKVLVGFPTNCLFRKLFSLGPFSRILLLLLHFPGFWHHLCNCSMDHEPRCEHGILHQRPRRPRLADFLSADRTLSSNTTEHPHLGPQMEWISSTLSENNHTFLVCCGLWHEKPTFVATCGLMCLQNHTCVARCGLVVASRACFPCKKSHPDPRTTRNFRHFRQRFKQDSKVRRLGRHFATPQYWDGIWSQSETRLQIRFPNTGTVFEASLKSASIRLQIRFSNTGQYLKPV